MKLEKFITRHWLLTLLVMSLSAMVLGLCSFNLFYMLKANLTLIAENGTMALNDGALEQLVDLCTYGLLSVVSYIIFKACEKVLVDMILK